MNLPGFAAEASAYRTAQHYQSGPMLANNDRSYGHISSAVFSQVAIHSAIYERALDRPVNGGCPSGAFCCGGVDDTGRCNGDCCSNPRNCCSDGSCCPPALECCSPTDGSSICSDLHTDAQNCGACGHSCRGGTCSGGQCTNCPAGLTACGGSCVDLTADPANCGTCGNDCSVGCDTPTCLCCNGSCSDLWFDDGNCGACGIVCPENSFCFFAGCTCIEGFDLCVNDCIPSGFVCCGDGTFCDPDTVCCVDPTGQLACCDSQPPDCTTTGCPHGLVCCDKCSPAPCLTPTACAKVCNG
jgi:hypothetical protein